MPKAHVISAIDIGTEKVTTLIVGRDENSGTLQILGASSVPSRGIKKSQVVDLEDTIEVITKSLDGAERMAGFGISSAFVSISGTHVSSQNSKGVVAVANPEGDITGADVKRVIEAARAISLPSAREVVHVIPREFKVDSQDGIKDPVGMSGVRLEAEAHIVTGSATALRNVAKCVSEVGVQVSGFVFSGLAASYSVLSETEKELGVVVLDIGAGTTAMAVFIEGSLAYSAVLPIGARHITQDIALGSHISLDSAGKVKLALSSYTPNSHEVKGETREQARERKKREDELDVRGLNLEEDIQTLSRKTLVETIIHPRLKELFEMVGSELEKEKLFALVPAGIVLTGGGALTASIVDVCKRTLSLSTRIGIPMGVKGLVEEIDNPSFAVSMGLVLYGAKEGGEEVMTGRMGKSLGSLLGRVLDLVSHTAKRLPQLFKSLLP